MSLKTKTAEAYAQDIQLFVSPTGRDAWSGKLPAPNRAQSDGPLATLETAQRKTREILKATEGRKTVRVVLRGGRYQLQQPLVFGAEDSGIPMRADWNRISEPEHPVVYCAYQGEKPIVSGGRRIRGWQVKTLHGRQAWVAELPEVKKGKWYFHQLWVNGQRRLRPRLPRQGQFRIAEALDANFKGDWYATIMKGSRRFRYAAGDLQPWQNLADVEICVMTLWIEIRMRIKALDEKRRIVYLDRNSGRRLTDDGGTAGALYSVENVFEALDQPGQWYLDRRAGKLYYLPRPGERPDTAEVIAPVLPEIMRLEGRKDRPVESLRFEGLTFAHNEWELPAAKSGSVQAAWEVPAALRLRHARNCRFERCAIRQVGTYGIEMTEGCADILVRGNTISDLGAGGVKVWHGNHRNTIADNEICDGGHRFPSAVGVLIGKASGNQVLHNHIHDFFYTGVSVGWVWGYAESGAYGNIIEWNHIHDLGKFALSDMGGIYTLGVQPGTRLRYNLIHDVNSRTYGGWAIYPDEGSTDILIENNICYRTKSTVFHQHYGRNNIVRNNIFAFGGEGQIQRSRAENHVSFVFEHNLVFYERGQLLAAGYGGQESPDNLVLRQNLYWRAGGPVVVKSQPKVWFGSRPFPDGFRPETPRFDTIQVGAPAQGLAKSKQASSRALGQVPLIPGLAGRLPTDATWNKALLLPALVDAAGKAAIGVCVETRLLRSEQFLYARVCCQPLFGRIESSAGQASPWDKEHVELFLVPDIVRQQGIQMCLSRDGLKEAKNIRGKKNPAAWDGIVRPTGRRGRWIAIFRVSLRGLIEHYGASGPAWGIFTGYLAPGMNIKFKQWQAAGMDPGSVIADPLFVNPAKGDFRLRQNSPALKIGFRPFDLTGVGPRPEFAH